MDVKALYPFILKNMAGDSVRKTVEETDIEWDNVSTKDLTRYVALTVDRTKVVEAGLEEVVPIPKSRTTINSFANPRGKAKETNGDNQFNTVEREPTNDEMKNLIAMALEVTVIECMEKHFYKIGGKMYQQSSGGSIGSALTGETSRIHMLRWDRIFVNKIQKLGIKLLLYKRYVDDVVIVLPMINKGWMYDKMTDKMIYRGNDDDDDLTEESEADKEKRTMTIIREIANTIDPQIQMTIDYPSNHEDKKMPVLDLKVWIDGDEGEQSIKHIFYKKKMLCPFTILKRSAVGSSTKRNTMFQEALRRLRNCSKDTEWSEKARHLTEWQNMLRVSGYAEEYRYNIMLGAIKRHEEMKEKDRIGEIQFYRNRKQIVEMKIQKGGNSAATWFLKGDITGVVSVTATPEGKLMNIVKETLRDKDNPDGGRLLVIEEGGDNILLKLRKKDPFRRKECTFGDPNCLVDTKYDCSTMSACYRIICASNKCVESEEEEDEENDENDDVERRREREIRRRKEKERRDREANDRRDDDKMNYVGQSGRSIHARMVNHRDKIRRQDPDHPITKHHREYHEQDDPVPTVTIKKISSHRSNLNRRITEGLVIEKQDERNSMNGRNEWNSSGIVRLEVVSDRARMANRDRRKQRRQAR